MATSIIKDSLNGRFINSTSSQTIIEKILSYPSGSSFVVRFSGEAGTTIVNSMAQTSGIAFKADTNIVDMFVGEYAASKVYVVRITKQSVGNYTVVRKSATLA